MGWFPTSKAPTPLGAAPLSSSATAAGTPARARWYACRTTTSTSAASPAKCVAVTWPSQASSLRTRSTSAPMTTSSSTAPAATAAGTSSLERSSQRWAGPTTPSASSAAPAGSRSPLETRSRSAGRTVSARTAPTRSSAPNPSRSMDPAAGGKHYHPACARCVRCHQMFTEGEEMYLTGSEVWHPICKQAARAEKKLKVGGKHRRTSETSISPPGSSIGSPNRVICAKVDNEILNYKDLAALPKIKAIYEVQRPDLISYEPYHRYTSDETLERYSYGESLGTLSPYSQDIYESFDMRQRRASSPGYIDSPTYSRQGMSPTIPRSPHHFYRSGTESGRSSPYYSQLDVRSSTPTSYQAPKHFHIPGPTAPSPQTLLGLPAACSPSAGIAGGHQHRTPGTQVTPQATRTPAGSPPWSSAPLLSPPSPAGPCPPAAGESNIYRKPPIYKRHDDIPAATKSKTSEDIAQSSKYSPAYSPDTYYHSESEYWSFQSSPKAPRARRFSSGGEEDGYERGMHKIQSGIGRLILREEMKARSNSYADPWTPPRSSASSREALHTAGYEGSLNGSPQMHYLADSDPLISKSASLPAYRRNGLHRPPSAELFHYDSTNAVNWGMREYKVRWPCSTE
ncbi:actin-binding LIM protein 3 isoform X20 [Anas platyrhynchos]|uniref:actin-binding LIM protein 3 isoform X20 n=1 Tax=Anas platyrhynchos TaxID=8839 RepID=UPI003AF20469